MLGIRLKHLRQARSLTIKNLAKIAQVDKNTIVRSEKGHGNPSLKTLKKLAKAFEVDIGKLIKEELEPGFDYLIFKPQTKTLREANSNDNITTNLPFSILNAQIINLQPGECSQTEKHQGEELILCLRGAIEIKIQKTSITLNQNDAINFFSAGEHSYANSGKLPTTALLIWTKATIGK